MILDDALHFCCLGVSHPKTTYLKIVSDFLSKNFFDRTELEMIQGLSSSMVGADGLKYTEELMVEVSG